MNKKYITIGITCGFVIIAGICYSLAFHGCSTKATLSSSLSKEENAQDKSVDQLKESSSQNQDPSKDITMEASKAETEDNQVLATIIYVHICGAVMNPGVYQTETGARIYDLIEMSGGFRKDAAGDYINQAQQVTDGQRIYIPTQNEVKSLSADEYMVGDQSITTNANETSGLININTASAEELMALPGIGQSKADNIIEYRTTNGKFKTIEDIMNITGIKEGVFNRISSYITAE